MPIGKDKKMLQIPVDVSLYDEFHSLAKQTESKLGELFNAMYGYFIIACITKNKQNQKKGKA